MDEPPAESGSCGGSAAVEGPVVQVAQVCLPSSAVPLRLLKWKVKPGSFINVGSVLALAVPIPQEKKGAEGVRFPDTKVKADRAGVVKELCCQVGQVLLPGGVIVKVEDCRHPVVMKRLCADCGQDLTQLQSANGNQKVPISTATVSMVHSVPELMVSAEQAEQLGREDQQRLHRHKKLVLMVDLDQTLIHTTEQHCHRISNKGIFHFQLRQGGPILHTRLRPHCKEFLEKIANLYELHVFTFGSRLYAHTIAGFLDPEKKLFSHRILSRDECIDPFSKVGNLRTLFPCGDSMVCIIDDREDVWKFAPNLITVQKYTYFQGTGNINAHPGSQDAQTARKGVQLSRMDESAKESGPADEPYNGLSRKTKDHSKEDSASSNQRKSTNEQTHPSCAGGDEYTQIKGSERETEVSSVTENKKNETKAGICSEGADFPETSLGSGCLEKQELKMQSQNSEQSGVTTGEEILDHNIEEEEEDPDQDDHLIYLEEVLNRIHAEYFARYNCYLMEIQEMPDIRKIVPELKSKTLEGTRVVFSGLYPTNYPMEKTREFYHARALGANISKNIILKVQDPNRTTHVIAARAGTEKVRQAQACKHLHVVNPDWLWSCLERWERVEEQLYPLKEDYSRTPRSSSPVAFTDAQGSVKQTVFEPFPVQARASPSPPGVRTYDPVTGKLILRGPPAGWPSPFLQTSPSEPSTLRGPVVQVTQVCLPPSAVPLRLLKWKVKPGSYINVGSVLALVVPIHQEKKGAEGVRFPDTKVKADRAGVVKELCCQVGQVLRPGGVIAKLEECSHHVVMKGLCAECGQDLTQLQSANGQQQVPISTATVSMVHSVPELMVSAQQAEQLGREDQQRLHRNKKLVLMMDLDQTLIHTTEQHCHRISNKGIFQFQLGPGGPMLHTRLRPHCKEFLEKIAKLYELHLFTFRSRFYAHTIAGFLDPEKRLFSHRILSRDECIDPFSNMGTLRTLFPCGDSMVCILDDHKDVWEFAPNLITVQKYTYFQGTGNINAHPGSQDAQTARKGVLLSRMDENAKESGPGGYEYTQGKVSEMETEVSSVTENEESKNKAGICSEGAELPDTSLGSGCSEKQELKTESQNSEQSGVTTGEEILDHNIEDEEQDPDQDDHLIYLEEVLNRIHSEYFTCYDHYLKKEVPEMPDIRKIVPELKSKTLEGTTVVFSGLYPTSYPMERTKEFYHARALGANISKNIILKVQDPNRTTHLIAARAGTEKVRQAQACKHLHVVNPDWLWSCLERWQRVEEKMYPLKEDNSRTPQSSSPTAFTEPQVSVKQTVFQPFPVQARASEKLVFQGPPAGWPSPFLQPSSSPSDPSTHRGSPQNQAEDAAGLSPDNEQPGQSRRDRHSSMSETMSLYILCKEDQDSMDREVDDILWEGRDNDDSECQAKEKAKTEKKDGGEEERRRRAGFSSGLGPQAGSDETSKQTASPARESQSDSPHRGHKRKHDEAMEEEEEEEGVRAVWADEESSKDSGEDEEENEEREESKEEVEAFGGRTQ